MIFIFNIYQSPKCSIECTKMKTFNSIFFITNVRINRENCCRFFLCESHISHISRRKAPQGLSGKAFASHAGDRGSIPGRNRQVVTAPMPTARQQIWCQRSSEITIKKESPVTFTDQWL